MSLQALGGAKAAAVSNISIPSLGEFNRLTGKTVVKHEQLWLYYGVVHDLNSMGSSGFFGCPGRGTCVGVRTDLKSAF